MAKLIQDTPSYIAWKKSAYIMAKEVVARIKEQMIDEDVLSQYHLDCYCKAFSANSPDGNRLSIGINFIHINPLIKFPNSSHRRWASIEELFSWEEINNNLDAILDGFYNKVEAYCLTAPKAIRNKSLAFSINEIFPEDFLGITVHNNVMLAVMNEGFNLKDIIFTTNGIRNDSSSFLEKLNIFSDVNKVKIDSNVMSALSKQVILLFESKSLIVGKNELSTLLKIVEHVGTHYKPDDLQKLFSYYLSNNKSNNKFLVSSLLDYCPEESITNKRFLEILNDIEDEKTKSKDGESFVSEDDSNLFIFLNIDNAVFESNFKYYVNMPGVKNLVCLRLEKSIRDDVYKGVLDFMMNKSVYNHLGEKIGIKDCKYLKNFNGEDVMLLLVDRNIYTEKKLNKTILRVLNLVSLRTQVAPTTEHNPFLTLISKEGLIFAESVFMREVLEENLDKLSFESDTVATCLAEDKSDYKL